MTEAPTAGPSPAAEAIRRRVAQQRAARPIVTDEPAAPQPAVASLTPLPTKRRRTPLQTMLLDGATISALLAIVLGFVLLIMGWRGSAASVEIPAQISYLTSGGFGGLVLVGIGCGLLTMQVDRFAEAQANVAYRRLAHEWTELSRTIQALADEQSQLETFQVGQ